MKRTIDRDLGPTWTHPELLKQTVGKIVALHPQSARVFEQHQIDYCCKGNQILSAACEERKLDSQRLCSEIDTALAKPNPDNANWMTEDLCKLCAHIEQTHHAYLRRELPTLSGLIEKVFQAHGQSHPELAQLKTTFQFLRAELEPHLLKEEKVLFPAIRALEAALQSRQKQPQFPFGSLQNPIRCMEHEHDGSGEALTKLRDLTHGFQPPRDACPTYRAMMDSLARLESDLHAHIHKENQILFKRAAKLEAEFVAESSKI